MLEGSVANSLNLINPYISFVKFSNFDTLKTIARGNCFLNRSDIFKEQVLPDFFRYLRKKISHDNFLPNEKYEILDFFNFLKVQCCHFEIALHYPIPYHLEPEIVEICERDPIPIF